jgi:hypothetical protein
MERIARGIRGLTVAVWCLVAINAVQVGAWLIPMLWPAFYMRHLSSTDAGVPRETFESWEGLSIEEKLKRSSVVLVTEYKHESGKLRAIIKEQLKRKPDTTFHYSVGDEYLPLSIVPKENTNYGEGSLVLLQGSPATNRESYSIFNGSIGALGDMPVSRVRQLLRQEQ